MTGSQLTDEEIVAAEKREYKSRWKALSVAVPVGICAGIGAGWAAAHGRLPQFLIDNPLLMAASFGLLVTPVLYLLARRYKAPKQALAGRIQRQLIETHQRREKLYAVLDIVVLPLQAILLVSFRTAQHGWGTDLNGWIFPGAFVFTFAVSLIVLFRGQSSAAEDEWLHAIRAEVIRLAFLIAAAGICLSALLTQIDPAWGAAAAPLSLAAAMAGARIRFLILMARAENGDEA
jgi:hypothetical protein